MDYSGYKHITLEQYKRHWYRPDPFLERMRYRYLILSIQHSEEDGNQNNVVEVFLHHDLMVARNAAYERYQVEKEKIMDKYSINSDDEYDPALGKSYNVSLILESISDPKDSITIESTIDSSKKDIEQQVFDKLITLRPDSGFIDNIMSDEELWRLKTEIEIPYKKGIHTVELPFYLTIKINVV